MHEQRKAKLGKDGILLFWDDLGNGGEQFYWLEKHMYLGTLEYVPSTYKELFLCWYSFSLLFTPGPFVNTQ
jgi:hypothetical protein